MIHNLAVGITFILGSVLEVIQIGIEPSSAMHVDNFVSNFIGALLPIFPGLEYALFENSIEGYKYNESPKCACDQ